MTLLCLTSFYLFVCLFVCFLLLDENFLDKLETPIKIPRVTASIASYAFPSASYTFHNTCGANIAVTCGEKKAKRIK